MKDSLALDFKYTFDLIISSSSRYAGDKKSISIFLATKAKS